MNKAWQILYFLSFFWVSTVSAQPAVFTADCVVSCQSVRAECLPVDKPQFEKYCREEIKGIVTNGEADRFVCIAPESRLIEKSVSSIDPKGDCTSPANIQRWEALCLDESRYWYTGRRPGQCATAKQPRPMNYKCTTLTVTPY